MDDEGVILKTMDNFGISITSVKRYLQECVQQDIIKAEKERECGYSLVEQIYKTSIALNEETPDEDYIFNNHIANCLSGCNKEAFRIWQYTCEEMLNNAIEHSKGSNLYIEVSTNALFSKVIIADDGMGTFQTLVEYMRKKLWISPQVEDALVELYKGKFTTNAECHSGEGIFFSSKMVDHYILWSDDRMYVCGNGRDKEIVQSHILSYAARLGKVGTMVCMCLENETQRKIVEVFDMYTDIENGFIKTHIPVKEACISGEPVARSQARRICNRLEEFKEVILDFDRVEFIGQGFADEIFRVYALAHPNVLLCPINMLPTVERMIRHVGRGSLPENVRI